ncbi:MAG: glucosyltransferase domain-containing protein [Ruthenibacterium sp.]
MKNNLQRAARRLWAERALWLCAGVLVLLFYNLYLGQHYSPDTWSTAQYFKDIDAAGYSPAEKWALLYVPFAEQGRFVRGVLMFLLGMPNQSSLMVSRFANAVALLLFVCAFVCGVKTLLAAQEQGCGARRSLTGHARGESEDKAAPDGAAKRCRKASPASRSMRVLCFLGTAVLLCNPFFCDWLQFAECALIYPLGLLLAVLAARVLVTRWPVWVRVAVSALLAVSAAGIYQITLQFFVLFVMLSAALRAVCAEHAQNGARVAGQAAALAAQGFAAYLCAVASQYLFTSILYQNTRISTDFSATVSMIFTAQRELWSMRYLGAPSILFALCAALLAAAAAVALVWAVLKKRLSPAVPAVVLVAFAAYYTSVFVMMVIADGSIPHRTVVGFFGIPLFWTVCLAAALCVGCVPKKLSRLATGAAAAVLCVLLCFNWAHTQHLSLGLVRSNAQDIALAREMQQCISQYEQAEDTPVHYAVFYRMPGYVVSYPDAFQTHDLNLRAWTAEWSRLPLLNTVNGTSYENGTRSDAVYEEHFAGREWTAFSSGQVYCEGETAHIALY